MENINEKLKRREFRFIRAVGKRPTDKDWTTTNNFTFDSKEILEHNGNVGIVCGYEGLIIVDIEKKEDYEELKHLLPSTFTIETGNGGLHLYYFCDYTDKLVLEKEEQNG